MIKNKGFIGLGLIIAIVLGVAIVGGGAYYLEKKSHNENTGICGENGEFCPGTPGYEERIKRENQNQSVVDNKPSTLDITCKDNPNYLVVSKSLAPETGTDILIKYKKNNKNIICDYKVEGTDFEIKDKDNAEYFYAINKNLLILDSGTGPDNRGVIIYNLDTRKKVFNDTYNNSNGMSGLIIDTEKNIMTYWSTNFKQLATKQNCPQYYISGGAIVSHISLDLSTLVKKDLGENKCFYTQ